MGVKGNNLTVKFKNGTTAVDHVSLQMEKGIYGLLGENGAGKTTLMRVLTTILKPAEGSVSLNGIEYCEKNYEKIQKKIGYLPQERIRIRNLLVDFSRDRIVLFSTHVVEDLAATCSHLAVMRKGQFLYDGSVIQLLNQARGHVWVCETESDAITREMELRYRMSSRQYTEKGITMKFVGKEPPVYENVLCRAVDITLEDAYMYLMNGMNTSPNK